ncbi:hypothetical protein GUITHDRAFT_122466 [Guillardia theta CCMP2712]|uniref:Hyaluronan-mediated motility receptor C-terminal domain-containing protein n=2 Tax=Guillardia theta TaxID=55529 RepID=L1I5J3_GUITC|nr:hypothetical protein GUITHDRAFT_122466 [Guillardia theta CCMP2712]EKX31337.1 hypothetical protein GUITHDRAFT_122466 [Guillardia theta CCMP2712]|eukprot:XP_005818317.1 hypothetical protein GUITHDRAFT_122466 [Guillardia theta CCMP2712]
MSGSPHPTRVRRGIAVGQGAGGGGSGAGKQEEVLEQARILRMEAEMLAKHRQGNVELLQQEIVMIKKSFRDKLCEVERRNGRLTSELESLKKDLMIKADRVQRESDVARQWEKAWTIENGKNKVLNERVENLEQQVSCLQLKLEEECDMKISLKNELEQNLNGKSQNLSELQGKYEDCLRQLAEHRANVARARNEELQAALVKSEERGRELAEKLSASEAQRRAEVEEANKARDEVAEINAQLCGHRNAKQKIQYLLKVKEERERLKQDCLRLEGVVARLLAEQAEGRERWRDSSTEDSILSDSRDVTRDHLGIIPQALFGDSSSTPKKHVKITRPQSPRLLTSERRMRIVGNAVLPS